MKLNESISCVKRSEAEKRDEEDIEKEFKDNLTSKNKLLQRKLKASDENKKLLEQVNSLKEKKEHLKMENQRLDIRVAQRELSCGDRDVSSETSYVESLRNEGTRDSRKD